MIFSSFDRFFANKEAGKLAGFLSIGLGFNVAEVGAGKGTMSVYLANVVGPGGLVFATEFDERKLDKINKTIKSKNITNIQTSLAGESNPNLPDRQFDIIFMSKVYHHFTNALAQNCSFYEHLKPTGRLAIVDFEPRWYLSLSKPKDIPNSYGGHGIWENVLVKEVEQSGFKLIQLVKKFSGGLYCAIFQKS